MKVSLDCSPRSSVSDSLVNFKLNEHYNVKKLLGSGSYGEVVLAECIRTSNLVALKILRKSNTKLKDFTREFQYGYYLSPHRNIIKTFDVAFSTDNAYIFAQEYAVEGDLFESILGGQGLKETQVKLVAKQIASALEFMHSKNLIHRDIKPENILIYDNFSLVKLVDFGMTRRYSTYVKKQSNAIPYTPPEIAEALKGERYMVDSATDVWAFGILLFTSITANFPWTVAHCSDFYYKEWVNYQSRKTGKIPSQWKIFKGRALRLFRRLLEPNCHKRSSIKEINKYLEDTWLSNKDINKRMSSSINDFDDSQTQSNCLRDSDFNDILEIGDINIKISKHEKEKRIVDWLELSS